MALVTGASRNVGRAIALALASSGARVACVAHADEMALTESCSEINQAGGTARPYLADLRDVEVLRETVEAVATDLGNPIDILVHNAAIRPRRPIGDITVEDWDEVLATNVRGPFFLSQACIPSMREQKWGRIIHIGDLDAYWGNTLRAHVVTSKLAIVGLSRALANETARWGITVNTVVPGVLDTTRRHLDWYGGDLAQFHADRLSRIPQARLGRPEEVANACLFLASEESGYITGQELFVAGGGPLVRQTAQEY